MKTGKIYSFVPQESENENDLNGLSNLQKAMKDLQAENKTVKQRLEAVERTMQEHGFTRVGDVGK